MSSSGSSPRRPLDNGVNRVTRLDGSGGLLSRKCLEPHQRTVFLAGFGVE